MFYTCMEMGTHNLRMPFSPFQSLFKMTKPFGYLGGETEALPKLILFPLAELVHVISSCCEEPLHVTGYISHLLFCPYTV